MDADLAALRHSDVELISRSIVIKILKVRFAVWLLRGSNRVLKCDIKIGDIRVSDAKLWLIQLQKNGRGYSSIHTIRGVLRPAFQMAVDDDILLKNPFEFHLATVVINDSIRREAITKKQERAFLRFVKDVPIFQSITKVSIFYLRPG